MNKIAFFITICTHKRYPLFTRDEGNPYLFSEAGLIAIRNWQQIPVHFPHVSLSDFVIMPNHIHGILLFEKMPEYSQIFGKPKRGSLQTVIRIYKSAVTTYINRLPDYQEARVWQRGFYDHRIRNDAELSKILEYIRKNPQRWIEKNNERNLNW